MKFSVGAVLLLLTGCALIQKDPHWEVGEVQSQIRWEGAGEFLNAQAQLVCHGEFSDGTTWTRSEKLKSELAPLSKNTFAFTSRAGSLSLPINEKVKTCAYSLLTAASDSEGFRREGSFPVVGDISASGMPEKELQELLSNKKLNLEIGKKISSYPLSH